EAALRHGQPQSWMYEAMALAMQAADRPKDEIERVVMSAVDFCSSSLELMFLACYLEKLGLEERALHLYRQVALLEPLQPEPYLYGLRVAQRIEDSEGVQWACLGILGQAWPQSQIEIWDNAVRLAKATLQRLRDEGKTDEANAFETGINEAITRDCVVKVSWNGDADIDVSVAEPSGSVCSYRNPRTTGGGIILGDTTSKASRKGAEGLSEVYVCSKGFSGTYQVAVRRVWGNVAAGKIKVEVCTHYRGEKSVLVSKLLPLRGDEVLVKFDLEEGRRSEPLEEQQVANAAAGQLAVRHQFLAQQLNAALDPSAMLALADSRGTDYGGGGTGGYPFIPIIRGGAVGYQPVVQVLPEGTMLSAMAVVSADRRYVRFEGLPFFSAIGDVFTYNTTTGDTNQIRQGGGGGFGGGGFGGGGFGGGGFGGGRGGF
ncbi:MAG: hypothetical protein KJZ87_14965, partial [Thermoguttaceae bacterium]|nr:hypothetical protein [Thermoguttaceae bacterium]